MTNDLFADHAQELRNEWLEPGAVILRAFALRHARDLLEGIHAVEQVAPFRHMSTSGGQRMSVAMTNCGDLGWVSDRKGYRYAAKDPDSSAPWPPMPSAFRALAADAARSAGFENFTPDACLINRYAPGARMALHQDRDERDLCAPIVSVSLGLPVVFLFGGAQRRDPARRIPLAHGDVVVWGGPARLRFHGVLTLKPGEHPLNLRYNLTFRRAG